MSRPPTEGELVAAARRLGDRLGRVGWQLAVAESCTGGLVGHLLTESPSASDHFLGGVVCYSPAVKCSLLGVPEELIDRVGTVAPEVAEALVDGTLARFPAAELAVAVTGLAGPDGAEGKPVGLTYVAVARRGEGARIERRIFEHARDGNKRAAALLALEIAGAVAGE
ncbi:MAG TPA: nicotinamide-nucleotide amidohydrolase family protein [Candidatus Limnocylindria bacterium]|nr:nicotinamide-nucleotide amidohydrolase family protein [Candidatus Limnocylindria bacterium]